MVLAWGIKYLAKTKLHLLLICSTPSILQVSAEERIDRR